MGINTKDSKKLTTKQTKRTQTSHKSPPSWALMRSILTCKHLQVDPQTPQKAKNQTPKQDIPIEENTKKCKKLKCSGSLCNNTKVMQRPEAHGSASVPSPETLQRKRRFGSSSSTSNSNNEGLNRSIKGPLSEISNGVVSNSSSSAMLNNNSNISSSSNSNNMISPMKGMTFRRFSGCYECRMVVDPVLSFTRDPSLRATICSCPQCGEIFMKPEYLELHLTVRHAVSELGPEDTSKNIVEIIFQSSWLKKQTPVCKIDRILKVHNTQKTISKFEEYRDSIKSKATKLPKKHPRCIADGNELLRFHCATFTCSLGLNGSTNLCNSTPTCAVCSIIRNGFRCAAEKGVLTTASSGRAHDRAECPVEGARAMLVCRVIAGRVKKGATVEGGGATAVAVAVAEEYDSVAGAAGVYSNLDELYVFNSKAILPCFVVIYWGF